MENFTSMNQKIDILALIALAVLTPFFVFVLRNVLLSKASKNWPKVNGTIINIPNMPSVRKYIIEYEYEVGGTSYINRSVFYSNSDKKYSKHQIVDVFYNPKKPKQAFLEPRRMDGAILVTVILGMVMMYGIVAAFASNLFDQLINILSQLFI